MEISLKTFDLLPIDAQMIVVFFLVFIVFVRLFGKLVVMPFLRLNEEREVDTVGAQQQAASNQHQAATLETKLDEQLLAVRIEAVKKKNIELDNARKEAAAIVEKAEADAQEILRSARWELMQSAPKQREETFHELAALVKQIVVSLSDLRITKGPGSTALN